MFGGAFRASLPQLKVKLSGALIKLQIFLFSDGSESNIFVKVLNQIQEEEWICGLEEVPAEVQKRFKNVFKQDIQRSMLINAEVQKRFKNIFKQKIQTRSSEINVGQC